MSTGTGSGQFLKIKIEYQDEIFAIRLPRDVTFSQLHDKMLDRLGDVDIHSLQYKDEASGQMMSMYDDNDLITAISRNPKLRLIVN